jgi:hypothetical protein
VLTPRGLEMLDWSGHTCLLQGGVDYAFRHLEFWFNTDPNELISNDPFKSLLAAQRIGNIKPKGPVYISHNRWDPLIPYQAARQTAEDWCAMGADVEFWTNEQPPLFNKTDGGQSPPSPRSIRHCQRRKWAITLPKGPPRCPS